MICIDFGVSKGNVQLYQDSFFWACVADLIELKGFLIRFRIDPRTDLFNR